MIIIQAKGRKPVTWSMAADQFDLAFPTILADKVTMISADGEELNVILRNYHNVPHTSASTQVWIGEFARQVYVNLGHILAQASGDNSGCVGVGVLP